MSKNLNRRIHPIAEAYGLSPKKLHKHSRILAIKPYSPRKELAPFTPRELMLELKARGYTGDLLYQEVKVTEHRINLSKLE